MVSTRVIRRSVCLLAAQNIFAQGFQSGVQGHQDVLLDLEFRRFNQTTNIANSTCAAGGHQGNLTEEEIVQKLVNTPVPPDNEDVTDDTQAAHDSCDIVNEL